MRLSDLEQTDVLKERRLRENRDSMEKPILKIQNLNLYFTQYARGLRRRELHPLRDLSCKLFSGELTAVVGASGSGKSLLAHAILGILPYNCRMEGKISYQGEVLEAFPRLKGVMLGRGLLANPALALAFREGELSENELKARVYLSKSTFSSLYLPTSSLLYSCSS